MILGVWDQFETPYRNINLLCKYKKFFATAVLRSEEFCDDFVQPSH